jgi:hypothetical protein
MRGGGAGVSLNVTGTGKLCDMFRYLRLIDDTGRMARPPLFTAWSERVSGEASAPALLTVQTDGG